MKDGVITVKEQAGSLSSWRAWIEIDGVWQVGKDIESLSSWRAWIEIEEFAAPTSAVCVALLMESVD